MKLAILFSLIIDIERSATHSRHTPYLNNHNCSTDYEIEISIETTNNLVSFHMTGKIQKFQMDLIPKVQTTADNNGSYKGEQSKTRHNKQDLELYEGIYNCTKRRNNTCLLKIVRNLCRRIRKLIHTKEICSS
jgi:hypothetical protein